MKNHLLLYIKKLLIEATPKKDKIAAPVSVQQKPVNPITRKVAERKPRKLEIMILNFFMI